MPLPPLVIPTASRIPARLVGAPVPHPTSGYRSWRGRVEASAPIVALVINVTGPHASWTRTSHRGTESLEATILFSPYDGENRRITVSFGILDAIAVGQTFVDSGLTQPAPQLREFVTGELVDIAHISGDPICELKALFLARSDVASVRNGVWHAKADVAATMPEPWHTILTYGRTGQIKVAD